MHRIAITVTVLLVLASCAADDDDDDGIERSDLPAGWEIIQTPGGYGDVATTCISGNRLFVGRDDDYASSSVTAIADPTCRR